MAVEKELVIITKHMNILNWGTILTNYSADTCDGQLLLSMTTIVLEFIIQTKTRMFHKRTGELLNTFSITKKEKGNNYHVACE